MRFYFRGYAFHFRVHNNSKLDFIFLPFLCTKLWFFTIQISYELYIQVFKVSFSKKLHWLSFDCDKVSIKNFRVEWWPTIRHKLLLIRSNFDSVPSIRCTRFKPIAISVTFCVVGNRIRKKQEISSSVNSIACIGITRRRFKLITKSASTESGTISYLIKVGFDRSEFFWNCFTRWKLHLTH